MKLIKLTDDHYVIVDDSKIEVDDWYIDDAKQIRKSVVSDEVYWQHRPYNREYMKITHSTRPFGGSATAISLHEVKELIGEVDVEKKYTEKELIWAIQEAYGHGQDDEFDGVNKIEESIKTIIEFLQAKTQWEVEIIDGKLKLI